MASNGDAAVRVIVLTGSGGNFTSGNDLADFQGAVPQGLSAAMQFLHVIRAAKKPIVAAVEGHAVGIGTTMLLHCDFAYAGQSARFSMPFIKLALCPEAASSYLLPKLAGYKKAAELLMLGEPFSAEEAARIGLVNDVVADGGALDRALERASVLASLPAQSLRVTKMLLRRGDAAAVTETMDVEAQHFAQQRSSAEAQALFARFFAKTARAAPSTESGGE